MGSSGKQEAFRLGFLTALEIPEKGYVGGLLVTNQQGRPLEFQCTLPVKPNSTQEILYGPTLAGFILGELIGVALFEKAGVKPHLVLTDCEPILELREHIAAPVAFVAPDAGRPAPAALPAPDSVLALDANGGLPQLKVAPAANGQPGQLDEAGGSVPSSAPAEQPQGVEVRLGRQIIRLHRAHVEDGGTVQAGARHVPGDADLSEPFERVRSALYEALRIGAAK